MKNFELYELLEGIKNSSDYTDGKFSVLLMKNEDLILEELKKMEKVKEGSDEYKKFKEELDKLLVDAAKKDKSGNPITIPNNNPNIIEYDLTQENRESLIKKRESIGKKHKEIIETQKVKEEAFIKLMSEDCDLEFFMITESRLPEEITTNHIRGIKHLIDFRTAKK